MRWKWLQSRLIFKFTSGRYRVCPRCGRWLSIGSFESRGARGDLRRHRLCARCHVEPPPALEESAFRDHTLTGEEREAIRRSFATLRESSDYSEIIHAHMELIRIYIRLGRVEDAVRHCVALRNFDEGLADQMLGGFKTESGEDRADGRGEPVEEKTGMTL